MIRHAVLSGLATLALLVAAGCDRKPSATHEGMEGGPAAKPTVYTTFHPTTYFAQRIAGDLVHVENLCPPGEDPATWMPDDAALAKYQAADLIVVNGAEFEEWVTTVSLPQAKLVDTTKPMKDDFITLELTVTHSHGPEGHHSHEGIDGHTWLAPVNAIIQANEIQAAFTVVFKDKDDRFTSNYEALAADLETLDQRFRAATEKLGVQPMLCNHPAYNYVARAYDWELKTFLIEPDEVPTAEQLAEMQAYLAEHDAKLMLWEDAPTDEVAAAIATVAQLEHVVFSPAESLDAEQLAAGENYLTIMQANLDRLEAAVGG